MSEPKHSINIFARNVAGVAVAEGDVVIPSASATGFFVRSTTANRGSRRSEGIALTAAAGTKSMPFEMQTAGTVDPEISGLGAGSASWVRCSSAGRIERCTPSGSDDICGWAEADGRVHLLFGLLTAAIVNGGGGGGGSPGGSTGEVQYNNAGAFGGATNVKAGSGFISIGATPATTGLLRLAMADYIYARGTSTDRRLLGLVNDTNVVVGGLGTTITVGGGGPGFDCKFAGDTIDFRSGDSSRLYATIEGSTSAFKFPDCMPWFISTGGTFKYYKMATTAIAADRTVTLPLLTGNDTFVFENHAQPLANKTYLSTGAAPATAGQVRTTGGASSVQLITTRVSGNDYDVAQINAAGELQFGNTNYTGSLKGFDVQLVANNTTIKLIANGTTAITVGTSDIKTAVAIGGDQNASVPFRFKSAAITFASANYTLSAAEYECPEWILGGTTAGARDLVAPNTTDAVAFVRNNTADTITVKKSGGTGVKILSGGRAKVRHNGTDYAYATETVVDETTGLPLLKSPQLQQAAGVAYASIFQGTRFNIKTVIGEVQTSSTTTTTVASYTMTDETHVQFDAIVTFSRRTNVTKAGTYKLSVGYRRTSAGAPTIVGALVTQTEQETTAGDTVTIDVSSNDVRVRVTAADTDNRNWSCELRVQETTAA